MSRCFLIISILTGILVAGQWGHGADIAPLGPKDEALLKKGLTPESLNTLIQGFVDRVEAHYAGKKLVPEALKKWFAENPEIREAFWLALSPKHDKVDKAVNIINKLRKKDEVRLKKYYHLAIALAVVWDNPGNVNRNRRACVWGVDGKQFTPTISWEEIFDFFTNRKYISRFVFRSDQLRWPLMTHMVNLDVSEAEYKWALSNMARYRKSIAKLYPLVEYDFVKLNERKPKLGTKPYTLQNLLKYGGVCGDQAHFSSRVAKCFGVPSMKCSGQGRYGGRHAWMGYLVASRGRPLLEFTGRYMYDYYYTGVVVDPQTGHKTLDRSVALMYDGASHSYRKYIDSLTISRIADGIKKSNPELSIALAEKALKMNFYNKYGWYLLMDHMKSKTLNLKQAQGWFNTMLKALRAHPDLTIRFLNAILECIPKEELKKRMRLYGQAYPLYRKRPDLQIRMRIAQCSELLESENDLKALTLAIQTADANAKEGGAILRLVKMAVDIGNKNNKAGAVKGYLSRIEKKFPKKRGSKESKAYKTFKALLAQLK